MLMIYLMKPSFDASGFQVIQHLLLHHAMRHGMATMMCRVSMMRRHYMPKFRLSSFRIGLGLWVLHPPYRFKSLGSEFELGVSNTAPGDDLSRIENAGDLGRKREGKGGEEEKERENFGHSFSWIPSLNCQHNVYLTRGHSCLHHPSSRRQE